MDSQSIISEIEWRVGDGPHGEWTMGVTDDPDRRKKDRKKGKGVHRRREWDADSKEEALSAERHFIGKGMRGGAGGREEADCVCIFQGG